MHRGTNRISPRLRASAAKTSAPVAITPIFARHFIHMPRISHKGRIMPSSPIRKLVPFAEAAKKRGVEVLHLNIGQPDIHSPEVAMEAIHNLNMPVLEYSHSAGFESYRKGLVEYYAQHDIAVTKDQIIVTTGGSEALLFAMMSCFDPGDELVAQPDVGERPPDHDLVVASPGAVGVEVARSYALLEQVPACG